MTEQTDAAEAEALAEALGDIRIAGARLADWWTDDTEHSLLAQVLRGECVAWAEGLLASDWLAAREAAARAEAWDEGYAAGAGDEIGAYWGPAGDEHATNPYRIARTDGAGS